MIAEQRGGADRGEQAGARGESKGKGQKGATIGWLCGCEPSPRTF